jgi:hypothetical protein
LTGLEEVSIDPGNTRFTPFDFISYPISHSLVAAIAWATIFAVCYQMYAHYWQGSVAIWAGVVSHWLLDFVVHRPDLPLYAGSARYGLALWNHPRATIIVEGLMYVAGVWIYWRSTQPKDQIGRWGFWGFVLALVICYEANIYSPPPSNLKTLGWAVLGLGLLLVLWAWWFDRHREPISTNSSASAKSSARRARASRRR